VYSVLVGSALCYVVLVRRLLRSLMVVLASVGPWMLPSSLLWDARCLSIIWLWDDNPARGREYPT
jgi:hypothetical protein